MSLVFLDAQAHNNTHTKHPPQGASYSFVFHTNYGTQIMTRGTNYTHEQNWNMASLRTRTFSACEGLVPRLEYGQSSAPCLANLKIHLQPIFTSQSITSHHITISQPESFCSCFPEQYMQSWRVIKAFFGVQCHFFL